LQGVCSLGKLFSVKLDKGDFEGYPSEEIVESEGISPYFLFTHCEISLTLYEPLPTEIEKIQ